VASNVSLVVQKILPPTFNLTVDWSPLLLLAVEDEGAEALLLPLLLTLRKLLRGDSTLPLLAPVEADADIVLDFVFSVFFLSFAFGVFARLFECTAQKNKQFPI